MTHGTLLDILYNHSTIIGIVAFWVFSAAVSAMPAPTTTSSASYLWAFNFLHTIAGNLTTAWGSKVPGIAKTA